MRLGHYVLDGHTPRAVDTSTDEGLIAWARTLDTNRHLDLTELPNGYVVSTVFLGLDHQFGEGPPIVFETMTFPDEGNQIQRRYATYGEALAGHEQIVDIVKRWAKV